MSDIAARLAMFVTRAAVITPLRRSRAVNAAAFVGLRICGCLIFKEEFFYVNYEILKLYINYF
jgi:hypothetical protein